LYIFAGNGINIDYNMNTTTAELLAAKGLAAEMKRNSQTTSSLIG
jgi:hypothetical protein